MIDGLTMACINLHSVLRNLEDLCELDNQAKELIKGKNMTILFSAKGVPEATLSFKDGKCTMRKGKHQPYDMKLHFN